MMVHGIMVNRSSPQRICESRHGRGVVVFVKVLSCHLHPELLLNLYMLCVGEVVCTPPCTAVVTGFHHAHWAYPTRKDARRRISEP